MISTSSYSNANPVWRLVITVAKINILKYLHSTAS